MPRAGTNRWRSFPGAVMGLCLLAGGASLAAGDQWPSWQRPRVALERHLARDEFRIYYSLEGKDALPAAGRTDTDGDGVPDKIQDLALQLVVARRMYADVMGLRHPFQSPRYRGRVRFFDVNVLEITNRGTAGDAIVNYHRPSDPPEGVEVLSIDIDRDLDARNLTPAHELFHEFQNGYALFKNSWYTEGTARWAEYAFREGAGIGGQLPQAWPEVERLFGQRYEASNFWNALARAADAEGRLRVPQSLIALRYSGDARPIIEDERLYGTALIRALLEELDRRDDVASQEAGLDPLDWPETRQRAPENNRFIWEAVTTACRGFKIGLPAPPPGGTDR